MCSDLSGLLFPQPHRNLPAGGGREQRGRILPFLSSHLPLEVAACCIFSKAIEAATESIFFMWGGAGCVLNGRKPPHSPSP